MLDDFSGKTDKRTFDALIKLFGFLIESAFANLRFLSDYLLDETKSAVTSWNFLNVSEPINDRNPWTFRTIMILLQRSE